MPHTDVPSDAVATAAARVNRGHYTDHPRLGRVRQITAQPAIERDLRRAAVRPGMTVLEVGTGSGLTGALLAELVGEGGRVVSVDIDPALTERAATLHAERGVSNVTLVTGDGHHGAAEFGPYDVVMGWATPTHVPASWIEQCKTGAVICTPIYVAEVARTVGHVRVTVDGCGQLTEPQLGAAVYVDMGDRINTRLGFPMFYVDAQTDTPDGGAAWISVAWRDTYNDHSPTDVLRMLAEPGHTEACPLADEDARQAAAWRDFRAYCVGRDNTYTTTSSLTAFGMTGGDGLSGIGFSSGNNAAVLTDDGQLRANRPDSPALSKLRDYLAAWTDAGRPGLSDLAATLSGHPTGWRVRAVLP